MVCVVRDIRRSKFLADSDEKEIVSGNIYNVKQVIIDKLYVPSGPR